MKGGHTYAVPLCCYAVSACYDWRVWLNARSVKDGALFRSVSLPNVGGMRKIGPRALTPDGLYKALEKRAIRAGVEGFHPHILRHTFVTWMRAARVPSDHVAAITGHATNEDGSRANVMERVYFHKEAVAAAALASVESVFSPLFL
jgi:integrase